MGSRFRGNDGLALLVLLAYRLPIDTIFHIAFIKKLIGKLSASILVFLIAQRHRQASAATE
jgi:hypothetical protein